MSALPLKADMCSALADVCFGPEADICAAKRDVRFVPIATEKADARKRARRIKPYLLCTNLRV